MEGDGTRISISADGLTSAQLLDELASSLPEPAGFHLSSEPGAMETRAIDPTVLVAAVDAIRGAVAALLTGVLGYAAKRREGSIKIILQSGASIEVPTTVAPERLGEYISEAQQLDVVHVHVSEAR